jgi:hypothetical protein
MQPEDPSPGPPASRLHQTGYVARSPCPTPAGRPRHAGHREARWADVADGDDGGGAQWVGSALGRAVRGTGRAVGATLVLAGGVVRSAPEIAARVKRALPDLRVEGSRASPVAKSAAYVGLLDLREVDGKVGRR